jgi:Ribonuclease G/E
VVIRGRITSIEDHGCLVDIGMGKHAFLKFENIEDEYEIMEDAMEIDNDKDRFTNRKLINAGRIYDFTISPKQNGPILQLSLPTTQTLSRVRLSEDITPNLSSLQPGMLTEVKVEQHAKNGMCVNFMGGLYRGSIDEDHLGGWRDYGEKGDVMWWKGVFRGRHGKVSCSLPLKLALQTR